MDDYVISFYNDQKIKKEYIINDYFNYGSFGYIYRLDEDTCLKLFVDECYFKPNVLRTIKNLDLNNFYKIYDLLYDNKRRFCGYTMKYYAKNDIDITTMPTEYTLDNLYRLYADFKKLTHKHISAMDCYEDNVIMDDKNIVIIDADCFDIDKETPKEELLLDNIWELMHLFKEIYYNVLIKINNSSYDNSYILNELFDEDAGIKNTEKKLIKYKYPIDYFKDYYRGKC